MRLPQHAPFWPEEKTNMTEHVIIERPEAHPGVMVIRMNRPEKKNALTRAMYDAMADALVAANRDDEIRAVVLFGSPGSFTSGNDVADFMAIATNPEAGRDVNRFIMELGRFQKALLSGVDGLAIGIGTTMNLHCDMTFATPRTLFRAPFTELALVPEAASSLLGPRAMGHQRAFAMFAAGIGFSAEEARESGMIWKVVGEDEVEAVTLEAASRLAALPPTALSISRKLLKGSVGEVEARMSEELVHFGNQLRSKEAMQAFQAFMNRKK
jgi:enoyl-CoA hydratase/carnithine racemase